jgi:hypothetical protein
LTSLQNLELQETHALKQAEKSLESLNKNVKPEIQLLYDRLSLIYTSCRWSGNNIEILEEYLIDPPYDAVKVLPGKDGTGIDRMRKIVSHIYCFTSLSITDLVFLSSLFLFSFFLSFCFFCLSLQLEGERKKLNM